MTFIVPQSRCSSTGFVMLRQPGMYGFQFGSITQQHGVLLLIDRRLTKAELYRNTVINCIDFIICKNAGAYEGSFQYS